MDRIYDYINNNTFLELGFTCKDIEKITNKDIICCNLNDFEKKLIDNPGFRDDFFKYIYYKKDDINLRLKDYAMNYLKAKEKVSSDFVNTIKTWQKLYNTNTSFNFSSTIFDLYHRNELIPLFSIIFITTDDIYKILIDSKKILESEKDCLDEEEYINCLKEEFINALKEIGY